MFRCASQPFHLYVVFFETKFTNALIVSYRGRRESRMGLDANASSSSNCVYAWHATHTVRHFLANINGRRQAGTNPAQSGFSAATTTAASTAASKSRLLSEVFLMSSSRTISRLSSPTGCVGARSALLRTPAFQTRRAGMARGVGAGGGCIDPKWPDCSGGFAS